jgi:hypothetical protein
MLMLRRLAFLLALFSGLLEVVHRDHATHRRLPVAWWYSSLHIAALPASDRAMSKVQSWAWVQVGMICTQITSLQARCCPGVTLNAIHGFPKLKHLDLTACDCVAPATAVRSAGVTTVVSHLFSHLSFPTMRETLL